MNSSSKPIDDAEGFRELNESLAVVGFREEKRMRLLRVVAGVLHLGNISMSEEPNDASCVKNGKENVDARNAAEMLGLEV